MLLTLLSFIVAILILVSLHEFGHYIVARWCGIKVLRFSVGFGKPFYTKKRGDTEWCLAPIPLGGYVKMVDTREGTVAEEDLPYAFDKQHPAKRIAVVAAGPLTNLLLAVLLYGLSFSFGVTETKPYIGTVEIGSIAHKAGFEAGDKIRAVNGKTIADWGDAHTSIVLDLEAGQVNVDVETATGENKTRVFNIAGTSDASSVAKNGGHIGLLPFKLSQTIELVMENSAAHQAGLKRGDKLIAVNGKPLQSWAQWVEIVRSSPGQNLVISYERNGETLETMLRPKSEKSPDRSTLIGKAGLAAQLDQEWEKQIRYTFTPTISQAFGMGWEKMKNYSELTLKFFGRLITGDASPQHISGPITIADIAGKSAAMGLQSYLEFLALVSVSLGIMNLLPIPVLDGGHLVYYSAEWIRGKPLSAITQETGVRIGLALMMLMMFLAFFNDITRLFG